MSNLQFQDFNFGDMEDSPFTNPNSNTVQDYKPANKQPTSSTIPLNTTDGTATTTNMLKNNIFSFKFYQQYFDVDTEQVQSRLLNSFFPKFGKNYITDFVQPIPDLYGPFWVCITLIFSTAICGNLAHYIETSGQEAPIGNDFRVVTGVSTLIASYVILVPFAIYSLLWYRKASIQYAYLEILCAYGYSLSIFIPVSILWVVHYQWFRWSLIAVSITFSGAVLIQWIYAAVKTDNNRMVAYSAVLGTLGLHALLAIAFKEFYFDSSIRPQAPIGTFPTTFSPEKLVGTPALTLSNDTDTKLLKSDNQVAIKTHDVNPKEQQKNTTKEDKKEKDQPKVPAKETKDKLNIIKNENTTKI